MNNSQKTFLKALIPLSIIVPSALTIYFRWKKKKDLLGGKDRRKSVAKIDEKFLKNLHLIEHNTMTYLLSKIRNSEATTQEFREYSVTFVI